MLNRIRVTVFGVILVVLGLLTQATPVDVNGDEKVGPHEVIDLAESWKGDALPLGGVQPWKFNGSNIFYDAGFVGVGTAATAPQFPFAINTGSAGYGWVHTDGVREVGSYVNDSGGWLGTRSNHPLRFFTNDSPPRMTLTTDGRVGIGTETPNTATRLNVFINTVGNQAIRGDSPNGNGVAGTSAAGGLSATLGINSAAGGYGVYGEANTGFASRGVWGQANEGTGVYGASASAQGVDSAGVLGRNTAENGTGVIGEANTGSSAYGVWGRSSSGAGVRGEGDIGVSGDGGYGVYGESTIGGFAGYFQGPVNVLGTLYADDIFDRGTKCLSIDHPLDPANKFLSHASVNSPEMMNIYNGNATTDGAGYAEILLPDYFESYNRDLRYQLTVLDELDSDTFVQAKVVKKIENNQFTIRTSQPNIEISWQVTGIRNDAYAKAHRIEVEKEKSEGEKGKYLSPELFGQPMEKGIHYRPELAKDIHK